MLGYEWDSDVDNAFRPVGEIDMSSTTQNVTQEFVDWGNTVEPETATHSLTEYRAASGALVFSAGTVQWSWGLSADHYGVDNLPDPDPNMQQATVNLFADMGAQPGTLQAGLVPATETVLSSCPRSRPSLGRLLVHRYPVGPRSQSPARPAPLRVRLSWGSRFDRRWADVESRKAPPTGLFRGPPAQPVRSRS